MTEQSGEETEAGSLRWQDRVTPRIIRDPMLQTRDRLGIVYLDLAAAWTLPNPLTETYGFESMQAFMSALDYDGLSLNAREKTALADLFTLPDMRLSFNEGGLTLKCDLPVHRDTEGFLSQLQADLIAFAAFLDREYGYSARENDAIHPWQNSRTLPNGLPAANTPVPYSVSPLNGRDFQIHFADGQNAFFRQRQTGSNAYAFFTFYRLSIEVDAAGTGDLHLRPQHSWDSQAINAGFSKELQTDFTAFDRKVLITSIDLEPVRALSKDRDLQIQISRLLSADFKELDWQGTTLKLTFRKIRHAVKQSDLEDPASSLTRAIIHATPVLFRLAEILPDRSQRVVPARPQTPRFSIGLALITLILTRFVDIRFGLVSMTPVWLMALGITAVVSPIMAAFWIRHTPKSPIRHRNLAAFLGSWIFLLGMGGTAVLAGVNAMADQSAPIPVKAIIDKKNTISGRRIRQRRYLTLRFKTEPQTFVRYQVPRDLYNSVEEGGCVTIELHKGALGFTRISGLIPAPCTR